MKRRLMYFVIGVLAGMIGGYFYLRHRAEPPAAVEPLPEVAIQEGKTIDFSSGKPEIRDTPEDRAALEKAKAEMDEATKDMVFQPTKNPGTDTVKQPQ
jgi:hypothetical protein